jgi:protein-tyrosine phosphatase
MFVIPDVPYGQLAILPRPRGGDWLEDEIVSWKRAGITSVISLLEEAEINELDLFREADICQVVGLNFISFSIPDRSVPDSRQAFLLLTRQIIQALEGGQFVGIHCRMGVGGSACVAVAALKQMGISTEEAWQRVQIARKTNVPDTPQQREWIDRL